MTRIPNIRQPPSEKPRPKLTRQRRKRLSKDAEYLALSDSFKTENPECFYCGRIFEPEQLQTDHIVRGTAGRAASLLNPETWNNTCAACHDDGVIEDKIISKLLHVISKIEQLRGRRLSDEQYEKIVNGLINAWP